MSVARSLDVRLYGERIGMVEQNAKGRVSFTYDAEAMRGGMRIPLSISMPLGTPTYSPSTIVPFLEGLLPDNEDVREAWALKFGASPRDAVALLAHIGRDCAGAVEFLREDELDFGGGTTPLSDADIAARLRDLARDPSGWLVSGGRGRPTRREG